MVAGGMDYSVYAVSVVSPAIDIEPLVVEDMRRAVATSATLNVTHAAANPVAEMVITNFAYKESAKGLYVAVGTYYVTVTVAGNPDAVAIDSLPVDLMNGVVYQVVAIDDGNNGGFNLLVDDITD